MDQGLVHFWLVQSLQAVLQRANRRWSAVVPGQLQADVAVSEGALVAGAVTITVSEAVVAAHWFCLLLQSSVTTNVPVENVKVSPSPM
jgi:hypothetical protein